MFAAKPFVFVISLVADTFHFTGFGKREVPPWTSKDDSALRIGTALDSKANGPDGAGGVVPRVIVYNAAHEYIGSSDWKHEGNMYHEYPVIRSGSHQDITIFQRGEPVGEGEKAPYIQLFASNEAVCIAYIGQTMADGTVMGWLGDIGRACGRPWYHSNILVGGDDADAQPNEKWSPDCTWLDGDHSYDDPAHIVTPGAMQIHMPTFAKIDENYNRDPAAYCNETAMIFQSGINGYQWPLRREGDSKPHLWNKFWWLDENGQAVDMWDANVTYTPPPNQQQEKRRKTRRLAPEFDHLIASSLDHHSAQRLCESGTSRGPDFVSLTDGLFCDMTLKEHYPLCNEEKQDGCYHWDTHSLLTSDGHVARNYSRVERWD